MHASGSDKPVALESRRPLNIMLQAVGGLCAGDRIFFPHGPKLGCRYINEWTATAFESQRFERPSTNSTRLRSSGLIQRSSSSSGCVLVLSLLLLYGDVVNFWRSIPCQGSIFFGLHVRKKGSPFRCIPMHFVKIGRFLVSTPLQRGMKCVIDE